MAVRPTPAQFEALVPDANAPVCDQLGNYLQMTVLFKDWVRWHYRDDGTPTTDFLNLICASGCGGGGTSSGSSSTGPGGTTTAFLASRFESGGVYRGRLFELNTSSWTYSTIAGDMDQMLIGLAVHPSTQVLWAVYYDMTGDSSPYPLRLGTIDTSTGVVTPVAIINDGGSDIETTLPINNFCLEFKPDGTLLMGFYYLIGVNVSDTGIYTVNTTTGAVTEIGTGLYMVGIANRFKPTSLSYNLAGDLVALGLNMVTGEIITSTVNLTPNPAFGNVIEATEVCALGTLPTDFYVGLLEKNTRSNVVVQGFADIYSVTDGTGACITPFVIRMTGAPAMANVTAVAGLPS